ncbi:MAG: DUF1289 domain-containing protein [Gammaproteobacteria bacterium]|nr:DUF1289 domain-containing protein [Gammaproteobacteria bacterium]
MTTAINDQLQLFDIENPCIKVCEVNNRGYCQGCMRSREERFHWHQLNDSTKSKVLKLCQLRRRRQVRDKARKQQAEDKGPENLSLF